jgi:hypothetical protein
MRVSILGHILEGEMMIRAGFLTIVLCVVIPIIGCSSQPRGEVNPPDQDQQTTTKSSAELFAPLVRVLAELQAGQETGMNRATFGDATRRFATELILVTDAATNPKDKDLCDRYGEVLSIYNDASKIWDVKISVPILVGDADRYMNSVLLGDNLPLLSKLTTFKGAVADAIPLNTFPKGASTGVDEIVARHQIPISESDGWKTIPSNSVSLLWAKASAKKSEIDSIRKP